MSRSAVASDVRYGPLERAKANIRARGLSDKIQICLADGLCGIENYAPEDIFICGMGGELIVKIIDAAPFLRSENIRLILQPMTHAEILRRYLAKVGFDIVDEEIAVEKNGKVYQIIVSEYSGRARSMTDVERLLGPVNIKKGGSGLQTLAKGLLRALDTKINGLRAAGIPDTDICLLRSEIIESIEIMKTTKGENGQNDEII